MTRDDLRVRKTAVMLADGRALIYFGAVPERPGDYPDLRQLAAVHVQSQARWDQLLGEWRPGPTARQSWRSSLAWNRFTALRTGAMRSE
jgi:hypothetical protein